MTSITMKPDSLPLEAETAPRLFDNWVDPIETEVRGRARQFIEELIRSETRRGTGPPAVWARHHRLAALERIGNQDHKEIHRNTRAGVNEWASRFGTRLGRRSS